MLLQFKVQNYKVFKYETILDMIATQEKSHFDSLFTVNGNKILPLIEIHGANASGKSSILEAINSMFEIIRKSNEVDVNIDLPYYPYFFDSKSKNKNTEYEVSLCLDNFEYRYGFAMNNKKIEEEWLYTRKFSSTTTASEKLIFERYGKDVIFANKYNSYKRLWNLFGEKMNLNTDKLLILSTIAIKEETGIFRSIFDYFSKGDFRLKNLFRQPGIDVIANDDKLYNKFKKIISKFDPCFRGIYIEEVDKETHKVNISGVHKNFDDDSDCFIPLEQESEGTIKIFGILPMILKNLDAGGLICIDELDTQLHPLLFKEIVNMYKNKKINRKNAQIIYTAHSTFLFDSDSLRRDQLYLVEKNLKSVSRLYSLSEFRNLRIDADYTKKYLSGEFGAIPFNE